MPVALMSLGNHVFYVPMVGVESPGFETLQRDSSFTWVPQGRLNAPLAMQYTGPGQDIVVIEGRLFPSFFGGAQTLDALRAAGAEGKPLSLLRYFPVHDAQGRQVQGMSAQVVGTFVIMRVRAGEKRINSAGAPELIEFALELAAYGNDTPLISSTVNASTAQDTTASSQAQASQTPPQNTGSTTTPGG
jgi:uncharacterized protein